MNPDRTKVDASDGYDSLAEFDGDPGVFWSRLCEYARVRLEADAVCLLLGGDGDEAELRVLAQTPAGAAGRMAKAGMPLKLSSVTSSLFAPIPGLANRRFLALVMPAKEGLPPLWMVLEGEGQEELTNAISKELRSLTDMYQERRQARRSHEKLVTLAEVLDLGLALGESTRFQEAGLRICNELAVPMRASRVSLAWLEGQNLKLKATSHGGRISANSQEALALEQVMEEAVDQDDEVSQPELSGASAISREHRQFSIAREGAAVLSVPLRQSGEAVGAFCLERPRDEGPWNASEMERVRLLADLLAPRLEDLHNKSGWLGKRVWRAFRRRAARGLGVEQTGWKLAAILTVASLIALALIKVEYRIRAPFILKADVAAIISAPFPGYIDNAHFHLGDLVKKGQVLVDLDHKELLLEEANTVALRSKNEREARQYQAESNLAQMRVAQAELAQADSKLAIIRHRLKLARITAPFDGVIVEGDLRERISSPVQTGEALLKIVQLDQLFGQLQVDDRDISYLSADLEGDLAFASRPGERHSIRIDRFEPVAELRAGGTVFLLRAQVTGDPESWWRPGMSGVSKISVGKRSLLWIGGHRLVETLRLWLWI